MITKSGFAHKFSLKGHSDIVECIEIDRDRVYSAGADGSIKIWSTQTGHCLRTFEGHDMGVTTLCRRDNYLYSGSWDTTIRQWDLESCSCVRVFKGHLEAVYALCWGANTLFSASEDTTIRIWDESSAQCTGVLGGHTAAVRCLVLVGRVLYTGCHDGTIRMWNWMAGTSLQECHGHDDAVQALTLSGGVLYSSSDDGTVRSWDLETGECSRVFGANASLRGLCVVGGLIFAAGRDRTLSVWDVTSDTEEPYLVDTLARNGLTDVKVDNDVLWIASADTTIRAWHLPGSAGAVAAAAAKQGGGGGGGNNSRGSLRMSTGASVGLPFSGISEAQPAPHSLRPGTLLDVPGDAANGGGVSPMAGDGGRPSSLGTSSSGGGGGGGGEVVKVVSVHVDKIHSVVFHRGLLFTAGSDRVIHATPVTTGSTDRFQSFAEDLPGHDDRVYCLATDGEDTLFSGSADGTARSWSVRSGSCQHVFVGHDDWVSCIGYRDRNLFTGSWDGTLRKWDVATGKCVVVFKGHGDPIHCLATAPGVLFSGGKDSIIRAWDTHSGECIRIFRGHKAVVSAMVFQDPYLYTGSWDKTLKAWDVSTGQVVREFDGVGLKILGLTLDKGVLFAGCSDNIVRSFFVDSGNLSMEYMAKHTGAINAVAASEGYVYTGSDDALAVQWCVHDNDVRHMLVASHSPAHERAVVGGFSLVERVLDRTLADATSDNHGFATGSDIGSVPSAVTSTPGLNDGFVKGVRGEVCGWLLKRSSDLPRWCRRYITLTKGKVTVFASDAQAAGGTPLQVISIGDLQGVDRLTIEQALRPNAFVIKAAMAMKNRSGDNGAGEAQHQEWYLAAASKREADEWTTALTGHLMERR